MGPLSLRRRGGPRSGTPWREAEWCAVDLELTGLDPRRDEIIAIGAVPVVAGRVRMGEAVYTLVRAERRSEPAAVLTHKLRAEDLAGAPTLPEAIALLVSVLGSRIPVFHTAAIERAFLGRALRRAGTNVGNCADTETLGRLWLRERTGSAPTRMSLTRLAAELDLPADAPHHALGDAVTTACAFVSLVGRLDRDRPQTVGMLVGARDLLDGARRR